MKTLNEVKWCGFYVQDLFEIKIGHNIDGNKVNKSNGHYAYITRKESNNGLDGFVDDKNCFLNKQNPVITIGNETAEPFVQVYPFFTGTKVNILECKSNISKYALLFITQCLKKHKSKYSYSYTINSSRLKKQMILLPITKEGNPDYVYMEEYMKEKERVIILQYKKYLSYLTDNQQVVKRGGVEFKDKIEWRSFMLGELFNFEKGNQNNMSQLSCGLIPLVSAKKNDNGYKEFVLKNTKKSFKGESLTINNDGDGGAGIAYYQPFDYLLDSHVTALYPKQEINKYTMLFISNCITLQRSKFGHGYPITVGRLNTFRSMLPITLDGQPDYAYMEAYMRNKEIECLKQYVNYLENQLN